MEGDSFQLSLVEQVHLGVRLKEGAPGLSSCGRGLQPAGLPSFPIHCRWEQATHPEHGQ